MSRPTGGRPKITGGTQWRKMTWLRRCGSLRWRQPGGGQNRGRRSSWSTGWCRTARGQANPDTGRRGGGAQCPGVQAGGIATGNWSGPDGSESHWARSAPDLVQCGIRGPPPASQPPGLESQVRGGRAASSWNQAAGPRKSHKCVLIDLLVLVVVGDRFLHGAELLLDGVLLLFVLIDLLVLLVIGTFLFLFLF